VKAENPNYYHLLGLAHYATAEEIKSAYRKLAHLYHPDKTGGMESNTENNQFIAIQVAYSILSHPKKRRIYDLQLQNILPSPAKETITTATSSSLLNSLEKLANKIPLIDVFRSDLQLLEADILQFLHPNHLSLIGNEHEGYKVTFLLQINFAFQPLSYSSKKHITNLIIASNLFTTAQVQPLLLSVQQAKKIAFWDKYKYWLIGLITVLLCLSILLIITN